jgi:hypothetical protein
LNKANLRLNLEKCAWGVTRVELLGYEITPNGYQVCPEKLIRIDDWKYPTTGKQMQRHLGFFGFFRDAIPLFTQAPDICSKKSRIRGSEEG